MTSSQRTITTVGLGLRDETMIRSLVDIAQSRPGPGWRFVDDLDADVALCAPESPLARVALARGSRNGRPRCVCYGGDAAARSQYEAAIEVPIRIGELWSLLEGLVQAPEHAEGAPAAALFRSRSDLAGRPVAEVVSELLAEERTGPERWSVRIGAIAFELSMPQRTLEIVAPLDCTFDALVEAASAIAVDRVEILPGDEEERPRAGRT